MLGFELGIDKGCDDGFEVRGWIGGSELGFDEGCHDGCDHGYGETASRAALKLARRLVWRHNCEHSPMRRGGKSQPVIGCQQVK
jgi:hypothetical protein